jgi:hypothetical protein
MTEVMLQHPDQLTNLVFSESEMLPELNIRHFKERIRHPSIQNETTLLPPSLLVILVLLRKSVDYINGLKDVEVHC